MADEDEGLGLDEGGEGGAAPAKGGKGLLVPGLLKWVAIGLAAIILIVTVVVITMKIVGGNNTGTTAAIPMTEEYTASKEILDWYTSLGLIQTRTMEANPASVRVDVVLGYKKEDKAKTTINKPTKRFIAAVIRCKFNYLFLFLHHEIETARLYVFACHPHGHDAKHPFLGRHRSL